MGFKRFSLLLGVRIALVMALLVAITWLFFQPGYHASLLMASALLFGLLFETLRFINKTNAELTRFLEAAKHRELTQRFDYKSYGTGFEQLGETFTEILTRFQQEREGQEQSLRYFKAMIEQVPVPLISLHTDGLVTHWNHAARRLFGNQRAQRIEDFAQFNSELPALLDALPPGKKELVSFENDGMSHQLALSTTEIVIEGKHEKLISLQDIRSELDVAQLQAWQDLVRVLTHEIMNSITPVASLAGTASDLLGDVIEGNQFDASVENQLDDIQDATQRLSKRSSSLMHFVSSYRKLTRLPEPQLTKFDLHSLLENTTALVTQQWSDKGIKLTINIESQPFILMADAGMLEQVLINLLQNAEQALVDSENPVVSIKAFLNRRGHAVIQVSDNGPGISEEILNRVFVPFFTTKRDGSGVGLSLTRQVMIAHGGNAKVENLAQGGARFSLTF